MQQDTIGYILEGVGRHKMLKPAEQLELAKIFRKADRPDATDLEKRRAQRAKEQMILSNQRLVMSIAKKYASRENGTLEDLFQEGCIGLNRAVEKYDPNKGYKFSTYATHWIRQSITRARMQVRSIRRPLCEHERLRAIKKIVAMFQQEGVRRPTYEQIADRFNKLKPTHSPLRPHMVQFSLVNAQPVTSLNFSINEDTEILDLIGGVEDAQRTIESQELISAVHDILALWKPRDRDVFVMRYGLDGNKAMSFREIALRLGVSKQMAQNIHERTLLALKKAIRKRFSGAF